MRKKLGDILFGPSPEECARLRAQYEEEEKNRKGLDINVSMLECLVAFLLALLGFGL